MKQVTNEQKMKQFVTTALAKELQTNYKKHTKEVMCCTECQWSGLETKELMFICIDCFDKEILFQERVFKEANIESCNDFGTIWGIFSKEPSVLTWDSVEP